jgi:TIGR00370 family protein
MGDFKTIRYGERGLLVCDLSFEIRIRLESCAENQSLPWLQEVVPGYDSLLFLMQSENCLPALVRWLSAQDLSAQWDDSDRGILEVPVCYNGPDLRTVAEAIQCSVETVIELHSSAEYRVRMMGFTPGFPYLDGLPERLHLPRRGSPRNHIKPGTVAIGGSHAGIYSVASPGGWHLLGETDLRLFQPEKSRGDVDGSEAAFHLRVGDRIRFVSIGEFAL